MNFTRDPIIESVITPKEGFKLLVRSSSKDKNEEYSVDAVEVISFGNAMFFRSLEKPKAFVLPVSDYEIIEVKEARVVLKKAHVEKPIKIAGGKKEAPKEEEAQKEEVEEAQPKKAKRKKRTKSKRADEQKTEGTQEQPSEKKKEEKQPPQRKMRELLPPPSSLISASIPKIQQDQGVSKDETHPVEEPAESELGLDEYKGEQEDFVDERPEFFNEDDLITAEDIRRAEESTKESE